MLKKLVKYLIFPTSDLRGDWYKSKGYENFDNYLQEQRKNSNQPLHGVLSDVDISHNTTTSYSISGLENKLEGVRISMKELIADLPYDSSELPGKGKHIVAFLGSGEPYQYSLRGLAIEALKTGATVHGFNYSGMYASTGEAKCFEDLVNDGFAVVYKLIKEERVHPNDIVLQGNCLGSAVAEAVARKVDEHFNCKVRQINSNSFKSLTDVITYQYPFLERFRSLLEKLLKYSGWYVNPGETLKETNPYACYIHRSHDKTLGQNAKISTILGQSSGNSYGDYDTTRDMLNSHSEMVEAKDWSEQTWKQHYKESWLPKDKNGNIISGTKYDDPHELHLYQLRSSLSQDGKITTMFDFVNTYLDASQKYIDIDQNRAAVEQSINDQTKTLQEISRQPTKRAPVIFSRQEGQHIETMISMVVDYEKILGPRETVDGNPKPNVEESLTDIIDATHPLTVE